MSNDDSEGATRRQVLAGAAGAASLPLWANTSETVRAAYERNHGDDVPTTGATVTTADMAALYMREDFWDDVDFDYSVRAYMGDTALPNGMVGTNIEFGPFDVSTSLTPEQARDLAKRLMQAATDAEVMTQASMKDYREGTQ